MPAAGTTYADNEYLQGPVPPTESIDRKYHSHKPPPDLSGQEPDRILPALIEYASSIRASDLYVFANESDFEFSIRHLGIMRPVGAVPVEIGRRCLLYIKTMAGINISERRRPLEGRWLYNRQSGHQLDLRIGTIPTLHGEDCTIRILDQLQSLLSIDQLGMHPYKHAQFMQFLQSPSGLILVTGPTESGKTTTLYGGLAYLNNGDRKINTIEDPIEYSLPGIRQSQANPSQGTTFDILLRGVLRQAPDVIMIGEIREEETAQTAVRAASTGHLVLSTLHAPVASAAVHSLIRLGVNATALGNSLLGIVSQRLVRTICLDCKEVMTHAPKKTFESIRQWLAADEGELLYSGVGCPMCMGTGYAGRTGIFEVLRVTPGVRALIEAAAPVSFIRRKALEDGMMEFRHAAMLKVARGVTTLEEVVRILPLEYLSAPEAI